MRGNPSKQTRILLTGLGVVALLSIGVLWMTLARRSATTASASSPATAASDAHPETPDGLLPASGESERDRRESAASAVPATIADASSAITEEMVEVLVIDRANDKPVAQAEIVYRTYTAGEERRLKYWNWLSAGEFDEELQKGSETATTDADGKARIKMPKHGAIVAGRAGELWGYGQLRHDTDSPWRLELDRDATLSALVVDARGNPVGGARVVIRMRSGEWFWDTVRAESRESDGLAIMPHAGFMMRQNNGGQAAVSIALGGVLEKSVEVVLDPAHLPKDPVRLVVPASGECEVLVVGPDGQPSVEELDVSLRQLTLEETAQAGIPESNHSAFIINGVRGRALFRHVSPGLELLATVSRPGTNSSHSARASGPTAVGRRATITVHLGQTLAIVRGRALDAQGSPLKKARFHAWVEGEEQGASGSDHNWEVESDDEGRFHVDVEPRTIENGASSIVLIEPDEHGVELRFASRPLPTNLPPGVHEMGDFVLALTPAIASGRVVDGNNAPVRNASVEVSIKRVDADSEDNFWWDSVWNLRAVSDTEGRFVLHGRLNADSLALTASKEGAKADAVVVARGATDVVLRMGATGEIAGRVLLAPSLPNASVQVFFERTDGDRPNGTDSTVWSPAGLTDDGRFTLRSLRPGVYKVSLRQKGTWTELHSVEDVRVDPGVTTRDPRLDPLDLRTSVIAITLTIVDPDGQPVAHGSVEVTRAPKDGESETSYTQFENGKCTVTHDGHDVDVVISSPGMCTARIEHVHDDRLVTLRRAPRVRLVLGSGQRPPEKPFLLGVNLTSIEGSMGSFWSDEELYFDARGQISIFAPAPGRTRVDFTLTLRPNDNSWTRTSFASETETVIDVRDTDTEQVFEVTYDAKQMAATLEQMRKDNH